MSELQKLVQQEIEVLHDFFVAWFTGTANTEDFEKMVMPRILPDMQFIDPDGNQTGGSNLIGGLKQAYGSSADFRIAIRDVEILRETDDHLLVLYTEWQAGAKNSSRSENGRISTALITKTQPFQWLHLHETWLPESVQNEGDYRFADD